MSVLSVKIKRKGEKKLKRFDAHAFQNDVVELLAEVERRDGDEFYDAVSQKLDAGANTLDYKRYADSLLEILVTGGIIVPGGQLAEEDGLQTSPFCIFLCNNDYAAIRKHVDVFSKLFRRYRFLQKPFEDTLRNLLQYINKWPAENTSKLAKAVGLCAASNLVPLSVLTSILKENLVKEGASLNFATVVFQAYLTQQTSENLQTTLKKLQMDDKMLEFLPQNNRTEEYFAKHFEEQGLNGLVEQRNKRQTNQLKEEVVHRTRELMEERAPVAQVLAYLKQKSVDGNLTDAETLRLVWEGLVKSVDVSAVQQNENVILKQIGVYAKAFNAFATVTKSELLLILTVQKNCYEDIKLQKAFRSILQVFYKADVISENAVIYWSEKGALPQGKLLFMKQMEPFLKWLKEAEEDESDEEDTEEGK